MSEDKKEIIQHGIRWIQNDTSQPTCPECNSNEVKWIIESECPKYDNYMIWTARCSCSQCSCRWKVTREEFVSEGC